MSRRRFSAAIAIRSAGRSAGAIYSALKPDVVSSSPEERVSTRIVLEEDDKQGAGGRGCGGGGIVLVEVSSDDLSHLRSSLNSHLRLAKAALGCLDAAAHSGRRPSARGRKKAGKQ